MEERGMASLRAHAAKYVEALLPPSDPASQTCAPSAVRLFCEEAVKQPGQQQQMALLSDSAAVRCVPLASLHYVLHHLPHPQGGWLQTCIDDTGQPSGFSV